MGCLPCEKEIIDGGMGYYAAEFLNEVMEDKPVIVAAIHFYQNVLTHITQPLAQKLIDGTYKISSEQHAAVMNQINEGCYNADKMIAWGRLGRSAQHADPDAVESWVNQIFAWIKADQTFYTAIVKEMDGKPGKGK